MKNKVEGKVKQKRTSKGRSVKEIQCDKKSEEKLNEIALKNQQSAFVKEKIKLIFEDRIQQSEDGEKKTFITLKPRQELELTNNQIIENRISVIRSVSSFLIEQNEHNILNSSSFQYINEQAVNM
jgi:hypothetical protein